MLLAAIEALENKKASKTTIEGNRQLRLHDKSLGVKASVSESGRTKKLIEVWNLARLMATLDFPVPYRSQQDKK